MVNFTLRPLQALERTPVLTEEQADRTTEPAWTFGNREKSLPPTGIWTLDITGIIKVLD
jgi:hypothetical protein